MLRIGIIGAGSVGSAVGVLLQAKGHAITAVASRSESSALRLARRLGTKVVTIEDAVRLSNIVLITVNDGAIEQLTASLAQKGVFRAGQVVVHFSGSLPAEILSPARDFGAHVVSIHPLQSCAGVERAIKNLPNSVFSIEGDESAFSVAEMLIRDLEGRFFYIDGKDKMLYHAAAVFISNYTVTLADISKKILQRLSVPPEVGMQGMLTLLKGTVANLESFGTPHALTGPIARGDAEVVRQHIAQLQDNMPDLIDAYKEMAFHTIKLAIEKESVTDSQAELLKTAIREGQ